MLIHQIFNRSKKYLSDEMIYLLQKKTGFSNITALTYSISAVSTKKVQSKKKNLPFFLLESFFEKERERERERMGFLSASSYDQAYSQIKKDALSGSSTVLVFVSNDVDALCACKSLQVSI